MMSDHSLKVKPDKMWKFTGYQIRTLPNFLYYYVSMLSPLENVKVHVVNELEHILRFI